MQVGNSNFNRKDNGDVVEGFNSAKYSEQGNNIKRDIWTQYKEMKPFAVSNFEDSSLTIDYQERLDDIVNQILNGKKYITFDELKNNPILSGIIQNLDKDAKDKLDYIAKIEDKKKNNITEKELRLILTVLDAFPEETSRSGGSRFKGYLFDGQYSIRGLYKITKDELKKAYDKLLTSAERNKYFEKNKEIYEPYDNADGKITTENLNSLVDNLVGTTGIFEKFPNMKSVILKDLSNFLNKNWSDSFEEIKGCILGSININRTAKGYQESGSYDPNYGGEEINKMIKTVKSNLNIVLE